METIKISKKNGKKISPYFRRKIKQITGIAVPANYELVDQDGLGNYYSVYKPGPLTRLDLISGIRIHFV